MRRIVLIALGIALVGSKPVQAESRCAARETRDATVSANGASVRVLARAGSLRIEGRPGTTSVVVRGVACASEQAALADIKLVAERRGNVVHVEAVLPESHWSLGRSYASLDLVVEVPETAAVAAEDSAGDATIAGVASLQIEDSSGDLTVRDVKGDAAVHDSSGDLVLERIGGTALVWDSSGDIRVRQAGAVVIEDDSSGEIDIADVKGSVTVREDGSGGIRVEGVGGDFTVDDDGSGGIDHHDVKGRVKVPSRR